MAKIDRIAVRLDAKTKEMLQQVADEDGRSISSMVARIVAEWLAKRPPKRRVA